MKIFTNFFRIIILILTLSTYNVYVNAQCVTPVFTSISNSGPACVGGSVTLKATGTINGLSSASIRMAGIGANAGNRAFDKVFANHDKAGTNPKIKNTTILSNFFL